MLKAEDLHFEYRDGPVLEGVDLEVHAGELVGIVGPNGVGKTTLLRLLSGARSPTRGSIRIEGADLSSLKAGPRAKLVSMVPQNPQLPLSFGVLDLVLMGRNPYLKVFQWEGRHDLEVARRAMELTGTAHLEARAVGTLSGGERQRAIVAMALAQETPVLLLDEPTSSLDLAHQTAIMDLVRDVQRQRGGAVVVSMHDLTLAAQYCDRLAMLSRGRVYSEGPPEVVLTRENISSVYGAHVFILRHPKGGMPVVLPVSNGRDSGDEPPYA